MAEIRVNSTGGVKLYDADDSHYAQIKAGTVTSNTDVLELGSGAVVAGTKVDLNGQELILDADADTSITADTDDQIDVRIAGADDFQFTANTFTAQPGSGIVVPDGGLTFGSTAITSTAAELNILDGVTATSSELNLLDGNTSVGSSITLADGDGFVVNDGGTMKTIPASDISTYTGGGDLVLLGSSTSASAAAAVTIDNVFSSSYRLYKAIGFMTPETDDVNWQMRARTGGGSGSTNTASEYHWGHFTYHAQLNSSDSTVDNHGLNENHWRLGDQINSNSTHSICAFDLTFYDPNTLTTTRPQYSGNVSFASHNPSGHAQGFVGGKFRDKLNQTGLTWFYSSGDVTAHSVAIYGVKQS